MKLRRLFEWFTLSSISEMKKKTHIFLFHSIQITLNFVRISSGVNFQIEKLFWLLFGNRGDLQRKSFIRLKIDMSLTKPNAACWKDVKLTQLVSFIRNKLTPKRTTKKTDLKQNNGVCIEWDGDQRCVYFTHMNFGFGC